MTYPPPGQPQPGFPQQGQPQQPGFQPQQPGGYPPPQGQHPGYPPPQGQPGHPQPGFGQPGLPQQGQPYPGAQPGGPGYPPPVLPQQSGGKGPLPKILGILGPLVVIGVVIGARIFFSGGSNVEASVGDCLPEEPSSVIDKSGITVDCAGADAFWTITALDLDADYPLDFRGELTDTQAVADVCGSDYLTVLPGSPWLNTYYIYEEGKSKVDHFFCIESIQNPNANGAVPAVPGAGECFDSNPDEWWVIACDAATAEGQFVEVVALSEPMELADSELDEYGPSCANEEETRVNSPMVDINGNTTHIVCLEFF
jgi:hypothetical protein